MRRCRNNGIADRYLFRDHVRASIVVRERLNLRSREIGEIPLGNIPTNSAERLAISWENLLPGVEMGAHRFETAAKKPRRFSAAKETEGRLIKCKLERKMTVVIYRHKSAIHRVSLSLKRARTNKEMEDVAATTAKSFALVISEREVSDTPRFSKGAISREQMTRCRAVLSAILDWTIVIPISQRINNGIMRGVFNSKFGFFAKITTISQFL